MRLVPLLAVTFVLPAPISSCGLDIFGVCGGAQKVEDALENLPDKVRKAAEEVLDHLFKDLLPPTVDKITAAAKQLEDRAEKDYEKAINATREQLEELAERVVQLAEEYAKDVTKDVEEIVDHVEKDISNLLQQVISDVDRRVNDLLSRLENDGKELFCAVQGYLDVLEKQFSSYFQKQDCECVVEMLKINPGLAQDCSCTSCFNIGGFYPQCQCNPWGLQFGPGWYNQGKFDFLKCHLQKAIDWEHWTVDQIVNQLSIVQEAALSFRCLEDLNPGSTRSRQYFTDEYTNITHTILVWTTGTLPTPSPKAERPVGGALARMGADDPCRGVTIQECLTQVMSQVQEARVELQKAKDDFESGVKKDHEEVSQLEARMTKAEGNMSNISRTLDETRQVINEKADASQVNALGNKVASAHLSSECRDVQTPPDDGCGGNVWCLDRHTAKCADDEQLVQWHLNRPTESTMQIQFRCCKSQLVMQGRSVVLV